MCRIKIKNFGPIKDGLLENDGWIDVRKVTMFIGNQGSGKSTVAKLIATFAWIEKALYRGDIESVTSEEFKGEYCSYHRMFDYFKDDTQLFFEGDYYYFRFFDNVFEYNAIEDGRIIEVPKIMYVPAERNFLSTVKDADEVKGLPRPLFTFLDEFERSLNELKGILDLPIGKMQLEYDKSLKLSYVLGAGYKIKLLDASSGLHSLVPLYLVSRNLSMGVANKEKDPTKSDLSVRQEQRKRAQIRDLRTKIITEILSDELEEEYDRKVAIIESKYINSWFFNVVEEPEQNLFPTSQKEMLYSLLEFNNMLLGNKLIMTTHSPYMVNYLTMAIKAFKVKKSYECKEKNFDEELKAIVPLESLVDENEWAIYELDEVQGVISVLPNYKHLPEDDNLLNLLVRKINTSYDTLRQIEKNDA